MLDAAQAQALHGEEGDNCWNPRICYSRRSYARHHDRRNQTRNRLRQEELIQIPIDFEPLHQVTFAVLVVYRHAGADTPVHAIAAEVWQGQHKVAVVPPIHCAGLVATQVHSYVRKVLAMLEKRYGIKKFASLTRLEVQLCPIRPCPICPW